MPAHDTRFAKKSAEDELRLQAAVEAKAQELSDVATARVMEGMDERIALLCGDLLQKAIQNQIKPALDQLSLLQQPRTVSTSSVSPTVPASESKQAVEPNILSELMRKVERMEKARGSRQEVDEDFFSEDRLLGVK